MPVEKVAIFATSDIRSSDGRGEPVGITSLEGDEIRSTGALEKALSDGYDIYVVTTRSKLLEGDMWWVMKVNPRQIYMAPPVSTDLTGDEREIAYQKAHLNPYKRLHMHLGHDYPLEKDPRGKGERDASYQVGRANLKSLGYKLGQDIADEIRREAWAQKQIERKKEGTKID